MPELTWELLNIWNDWARANEVSAWGICDRYEGIPTSALGMKVVVDPSLKEGEFRIASHCSKCGNEFKDGELAALADGGRMICERCQPKPNI
jgi:formylmethanofuran dehydrogenase subunit E